MVAKIDIYYINQSTMKLSLKIIYKHIYFCFIDYKKPFDNMQHKKRGGTRLRYRHVLSKRSTFTKHRFLQHWITM